MSKIYIYNFNNCDLKKDNLINMLSESILNNVNKYKVEDDYLRSLIGWYLLKKYLKADFNIELNEYKILFNKYGKPYIDDNIYFNISHCKDYVVVIISDYECGIDIEITRNKHNIEQLKNKILTNKEKSLVINDDEVIKYWSIKEAYFKKVGTGIVLSKLKEDIDYSMIKTISIINKSDLYYLSYVSDDNIYQIKEINKL